MFVLHVYYHFRRRHLDLVISHWWSLTLGLTQGSCSSDVRAVVQEGSWLDPRPCSQQVEVSLSKTLNLNLFPMLRHQYMTVRIVNAADEQVAPFKVVTATSVWMCEWNGECKTGNVKCFEWSQMSTKLLNSRQFSMYHSTLECTNTKLWISYCIGIMYGRILICGQYKLREHLLREREPII